MRIPVFAVLAALVIPLAACGGGGAGASAAGKLGVELSTPDGWVVSDDGLVVARRSADLAVSVPSGPRVRVVPSADTNTDINELIGDGEDASNTTVVDIPERTTVAGRQALAITLRETDGNAQIVRRYVAAASPTGASVLFVLEAPADTFEASRAQLNRIPGWS